jgi:colicin import membrane protein
MKRFSSCFFLLAVLLGGCSQTPKLTPPLFPDSLTREQVALERQREEQLYDRELRDCYQRFAVNDCRREALARHREVLRSLRAIELNLNEAQRQQRSQRLQDPAVSPDPDQRP